MTNTIIMLVLYFLPIINSWIESVITFEEQEEKSEFDYSIFAWPVIFSFQIIYVIASLIEARQSDRKGNDTDEK